MTAPIRERAREWEEVQKRAVERYTAEENLYIDLNRALRRQTQAPELTMAGLRSVIEAGAGPCLGAYARFLTRALRIHPIPDPGHVTRIWRGQRMLRALLEKLKRSAGKFCLFTAFSSFSVREQTAARFAKEAGKGVPMLFELEQDDRPLIEGHSEMPEQGEVLLHPGSVVRIEGCRVSAISGLPVILISDVSVSKGPPDDDESASSSASSDGAAGVGLRLEDRRRRGGAAPARRPQCCCCGGDAVEGSSDES